MLDEPDGQIFSLVLDELVQRASSVDVLRIHVGALLDEIKHGLALSRLARNHERRISLLEKEKTKKQ